jgi:RNA 2',3'-cyclic 3'-phosphodiesterase
MRLFLAVELASLTRHAVEALTVELKKEIGGGRWVRPENIHLTLVFLGEQKTAVLAGLRSALRALERWPRAEVKVADLGLFPERGPARVLWLGLEPLEPLAALQAEVSRILVGLGSGLVWQPEARPFSAHLTLARFDPPMPRARLTSVHEKSFEMPTMAIDRVTLFESRLGTSGPIYQALGVFPLAESEAA